MRAALLLVGATLLGCGGAAAMPPARSVTPVDAAADVSQRALYKELCGAADPTLENDGMWLHFRSPEELWKRVPLLARELPAFSILKATLAGEAAPSDVAAVVDLSAPVDVSWPLGPTGRAVWSFRIRSTEALQRGATGLSLRRVAAGVWDIGSVVPAEPELTPDVSADAEEEADVDPEQAEDWEPEPESSRPLCRLYHAPEPVGYRVLCAVAGLDGLDPSLGFLLQPARVEAAGDIHVEVAGPSYASLRSAVVARMDRPSSGRYHAGEDGAPRITAMLGSVGNALLEHERVALDVTFSGEVAEAQLELIYPEKLGSAGWESWLESASQAKLPSGVALLPADSGFALGFSGLGASPTAHFFSELTAEMDDDHVVDPKVLAELSAAMTGVAPVDGHFALAFGCDTEAALSALSQDAVRIADDAERPLGAAAAQRLHAALGGWTVLGLDVVPERYLAAVQRLYRTRNLRLPYKPGKEPPPTTSSSEYRRLPAPRGMPATTIHWVERSRKKQMLPADFGFVELDYDRHLLFVPDGTRVWIVISRSESVATARARQLLEHRDGFQWSTLGGSAPVALASFDLRSLVAMDLDWDSKEQRAAAKASLSLVNRAPHQAALRVPLQLSVAKTSGGYRLRLQSRADLHELLTQAFAIVPTPPVDEE